MFCFVNWLIVGLSFWKKFVMWLIVDIFKRWGLSLLLILEINFCNRLDGLDEFMLIFFSINGNFIFKLNFFFGKIFWEKVFRLKLGSLKWLKKFLIFFRRVKNFWKFWYFKLRLNFRLIFYWKLRLKLNILFWYFGEWGLRKGRFSFGKCVFVSVLRRFVILINLLLNLWSFVRIFWNVFKELVK